MNSKKSPASLRWIVLVVVSLAMFGNYYLYDSIAPVADQLASELGFSDKQIGLLYTVYSIAAVIFLLIGGILVDKIGTRKTILLFGAICAASGFITAVSPNFYIMATGRFLLGLGAEPLIVAITTTLAKWFKGKEISFAMGLNLSFARLASLGADLSPTFATGLYTNWQDPLYLAAIFGLLCLVGGVIYYRMEQKAERQNFLTKSVHTDKINFKQLFTFSRSFWFITLLCLTFYSAVFPFRSFAIKFFMHVHDVSKQVAGQANGILPIMSLIATPIVGIIVDKVGKRALIMLLGAILILPVYLMLVYSDVSIFLPTGMLGIAFTLIPTVMWPAVAYIVDEKKLGTAYALMAVIQQTGVAIFNFMIGWSNDLNNASDVNPDGYTMGMWLLSILGVMGMLWALLLRKTEKGPRGHGLEKPNPEQ
ncbi:MAG: MFS transporter [Bacteroidota bacterium]